MSSSTNPGKFEGDGIEEPQGGDCDNDRTSNETLLIGQVEQVGQDLRRSEMFRRFTKVAREPHDLLNIHTDRAQESAEGIVGHAVGKAN
jgi:hypothetical protein